MINNHVFTYEQIVRINDYLLRRIPLKPGYNASYLKQDFVICLSYLKGLSYSQLADLTERLIKYCNPLKINADKMEKTHLYYKNLSNKENQLLEYHISTDIDDEKVKIAFIYNKIFITVIRNVSSTAKFCTKDRTYHVDKNEAISLLLALKKKGAVCDKAIEYLISKGLTESNLSNSAGITQATNKKMKITLIENDINSLQLDFKYSSIVSNAIKSLRNRRFDEKIKKWIVNKSDIKDLKETLIKTYNNNIPYDLSDFDKYLSYSVTHMTNNTSNIEFSISEYKPGKVLFKFDYNPSILKAVKSLSFNSWDDKSKSWVIHKLEIPKLISNIKVIENKRIDCSVLENYYVKCSYNKDNIKSYKLLNLSKFKRKPFQHQVEAAKKLLELKTGLLCDEQGLGKTTSSIMAAASIKGKKLVICPASLKKNWAREIENVCDDEPIFIAKSSRKWRSCKGWTIINYEILERFMNEIINENFTIAICDEVHAIKTINNDGEITSGRGLNVLKVAERIPYVFALTGTPVPNIIKDIFALLCLIRHPLSIDFKSFAERYCDPKFNGHAWNYNGSSNQNELNELLKTCMIRRLKEEAIALPKKTRNFVPLQIDLIEYKKNLDDYFKGKKNVKPLVNLNGQKLVLSKSKVKHTIEFADKLLCENKPVVIFTNYDNVIVELTAHYEGKCSVITGKTAEEKRQDEIDKFQTGETKVFIGNLKACSVGITLTKSCNLIFSDLSFVPSECLQGEDRIHRISQINDCNIYYMYAANAQIDVIISKLLDKKLKNISHVIDGYRMDFIDELIKELQNEQITLNIA